MIARRRLACVALLLGTASACRADAASLFDPARHMHTAEVHAGMTGYGLSVFSGTKIDKFEVEVISVLKNQMGPKHDIVLIRCHGMGLEHSGAIEGMSGSPIYLKDDAGNFRMIGAFALGWQYSKDAVAGVRPIEEMLDVPTEARPISAKPVEAATTWNAAKLINSVVHPSTPLSAARSSSQRLSQLRPLGTPLAVGGVDGRFFDRIVPDLTRLGLLPLQAGAATGGGAADPADASAKLEPGAAIALPVVTGDLDLSAIGTVTERIGDRVWAFGHEYNAEGGVDLPMGVGHIDTVIASEQMSFKIGSLIRLDGAIRNDEATGIAGTVGKLPATIPIEVTVHTGQRDGDMKYHFEAVKHPKLTPMGVSTALASAVMGHSNLPSEFTIRYKMKMLFDGGQSIDVDNTATSANQAPELGRDLALPLALAIDNPFARSYPTKVTADFSVEPRAHESVIRSVVTDKSIYKPGESAVISVSTIDWKGAESTRSFEMKLPDQIDDGEYQLTVGDADRFLGDMLRNEPYRVQVRSIGEVFGLIKQITDLPTTRLYTRLTSPAQGISVGRTPLEGLPASRQKMLSLQGRAEVQPYVESVTQQTEWGEPLSGSSDVAITIALDPSKAQRPKALVPEPAAPPAAPQQPAPAKDDSQQPGD